MGLARVTRNYQVTIPVDVRHSQNIRIGDKILFTIEDGKIELQKFKQDILDQAFGSWRPGPPGVAQVRKMRQDWRRRAQRQTAV